MGADGGKGNKISYHFRANGDVVVVVVSALFCLTGLWLEKTVRRKLDCLFVCLTVNRKSVMARQVLYVPIIGSPSNIPVIYRWQGGEWQVLLEAAPNLCIKSERVLK